MKSERNSQTETGAAHQMKIESINFPQNIKHEILKLDSGRAKKKKVRKC